MDSHGMIPPALTQEILKSRRDILALLNEIQERKRQQAAQFEGLQAQTVTNTQDEEYGDQLSTFSEEDQSLQTQKCAKRGDENKSRKQHHSQDEQASLQSDNERLEEGTSSKSFSLTSSQNDSSIDKQNDRTSDQIDRKLTDKTSTASGQDDSILPLQSDRSSREIDIIKNNQSGSSKSENSERVKLNEANEGFESLLVNSDRDDLELESTESTNTSEENLTAGDISVVLKDPSIARKCQGFRSKKTSSAHDNRLLLKAEGEIWCTDILQLTDDDIGVITDTKVEVANDGPKRKSEILENESDKKDNPRMMEIKAANQRYEARLLETNRRITIQIDRWSDLANEEMKKGWMAREVRCDGPDTVFCLDVSASMKGEIFVMAKNFVRDYVAEIQSRTVMDGTYEHISLVTFGKQTTVQNHLTYEYFEILSAIDELRPEGPSPLYAGLKMCMAAILAAGKVSSPPTDSSYSKVFLLTDGKLTPSEFLAGPDTCTEMEEKRENDRVMSYCIDLYQKYHLTINAICIGDSNVPFLESIAKNTGGELIMAEMEEESNQKDKDEPSTEVDITPEDNLEMEDEASVEDSQEINHTKQRELEKRQLEIKAKQKELEERRESIENRGRNRPGTPIPLDLWSSFGHHPYPYYVQVQSSDDSSDSEVEVQTESREDLFPPLGARVRTKADSLFGTITKCFRNGVQVTWDEVSERGTIREDICQPDCLEIVNQPRVLTDELIAVGCRVKRGPDWHYQAQDGYPGNEGVVIGVEDSGIVSVCWDQGMSYTYRFGSEGKFEIEVIRPHLTETPSEQPPLSQGPHNTLELLQLTSNSEATTPPGNTDNKPYRWRWKDVDGKWNYFPDDVNVVIEESYINNNEGSTFIILQDKRYKILFSRMVKVDVNTRTKYPVSRTMAPS